MLIYALFLTNPTKKPTVVFYPLPKLVAAQRGKMSEVDYKMLENRLFHLRFG